MQPRQTLTMSSVGQITIPRSIRKILGLEKGAKLDLEINQAKNTITLKKQPSLDEIFSELERLSKECPEPDPSAKNMTVNEMVEEELKNHPLENDTWV